MSSHITLVLFTCTFPSTRTFPSTHAHSLLLTHFTFAVHLHATGATKLRTVLLTEAYNEVNMRMLRRLEAATYITLSSDFWTDIGKHGVFACIAHPEARDEYVLSVVDVSFASHTGIFTKGVQTIG